MARRHIAGASLSELKQTFRWGVGGQTANAQKCLLHTRQRSSHDDLSQASVRFGQPALADGVPHTDLFVSQGHSIIVDGEWMMAQGLINDRSITYGDDLDDLTELEYFHIKLESHEAIYAAGGFVRELRG